MITVIDTTGEYDPEFMIERINYLNEEMRQKQEELKEKDHKIYELESYVFWHKTQEDKWKNRYEILEIKYKELKEKLNGSKEGQ